MIVKMHQAKSQLSNLIARVEAGEEVILARGDTPVAKIVPLSPPVREPRKPGALKHLRGAIPDDLFLRPMTEEELAAWEGVDDANGNH
jgi:prevent-host-death family protein